MTKRTASLIMMVSGLAAGAALGILFAPKKGKDTRKVLKEQGEDLVGKIRDLVGEAEGKVKETAEQVEHKAEEHRNGARRTTSKA